MAREAGMQSTVNGRSHSQRPGSRDEELMELKDIEPIKSIYIRTYQKHFSDIKLSFWNRLLSSERYDFFFLFISDEPWLVRLHSQDDLGDIFWSWQGDSKIHNSGQSMRFPLRNLPQHKTFTHHSPLPFLSLQIVCTHIPDCVTSHATIFLQPLDGDPLDRGSSLLGNPWI